MSSLPPHDTPPTTAMRSSVLKVLGKMLHTLRETGQQGVFHVMHRSRLLAHIVTQDPWVGVLKQAESAELAEAKVVHRPDMARGMPTGFLTVVCDHALWVYAQSQHDKIDLRAMSRLRFRFVRMPDLPLAVLQERQIALLSWFAAHTVGQECLWSDLLNHDDQDTQALARDVRSLMWCGCVASEAYSQASEMTSWASSTSALASSAMHWLGQVAQLNRPSRPKL